MRGAPELREREDASRAVDAALDEAAAGRGRALLVTAEAGLGKTALLDAARRAAAARGFQVGFGRGEAMEGALPFGVMAQVLGALDPTEEGVEALVAAAEPAAPYFRTARWLEHRVGDSGTPLLLALDDLQWADPDSLGLLAFLARRLHRLPVAVIGTLRPWPPVGDDLRASIAGLEHGAVERLAPLSRPAADALLADLLGTVPAPETEQEGWDLCQGNPLLVEQLAVALARGDRSPATGLAEHLLLARFAGLGPAGLSGAQAACVVGTTFRPDVVAEVADLDDAEVDRALAALWSSGLVVDASPAAGTALRFVHPLFAQALYDDLPPSRRQRLHTRSFEVLAGRGFLAEAAEHAIRADLVGRTDAVEVLDRAGRAALGAGALVSATRLLAAAIAFATAPAPAPALVLAHAAALASSGRIDDAVDALRGLLARGEDLAWTDRLEALRQLGRAQYLAGAGDQGERAFGDAVDLALAHEPVAAVQPLLDQSLRAWMVGGNRLALPLATRARAIARERDAPFDLRERTDAVWGHLAFESGDVTGMPPVDLPLERYEPGSPNLVPSELAWPWANVYQLGMSAAYAERFEVAERVLRTAAAVVEELGAVGALLNLCIHIANVTLRQGRLDDALAAAVRAHDFVDLAGGVAPYAALARAEALAWQGRLEESEAWSEPVADIAGSQWFARLWHAHVAGMRFLWRGDARAVDWFLLAEETTEAAGIREPCHMQFEGHAIDAHLAAGRPADAERVLDRLVEKAAAVPCIYPRATAALGRARILADGGDPDGAEAAFQMALDLHRDGPLRLFRTEAQLAYGSFLRRAARPVDARPHLADAVAGAEACGAGWLRDAAAAELRVAGGRRRRRDESAGLTPAERRVAELARAGHSNAEIGRALYLSVNTVETHLKRVFAKLGIGSRRQLPDPLP